jgi:hypothetical protein
MLPGITPGIGGSSKPTIRQLGSTTSRATAAWANASAETFSHTVTSGTELLLVMVCLESALDGRTINDIDWDSGGTAEPMTNAIEFMHDVTNPRHGVSVWYLVNPTAKTANITITTAGGVLNAMGWAVVNLDNVNTASPIGSTDDKGFSDGSGSKTSDAISVSPGSRVFHTVLHDCANATASSDDLAFGSYTEIYDENDTDSNGAICGAAYRDYPHGHAAADSEVTIDSTRGGTYTAMALVEVKSG